MPTQVAFVAIAGMITFMVMLWFSHRMQAERLRAKSGAGSEDFARLQRVVAETSAELARLKERVQVLEKLVTDDDRKLADEIERLRRDRGDDARR
jgi:cell division protein FtsB